MIVIVVQENLLSFAYFSNGRTGKALLLDYEDLHEDYVTLNTKLKRAPLEGLLN